MPQTSDHRSTSGLRARSFITHNSLRGQIGRRVTPAATLIRITGGRPVVRTAFGDCTYTALTLTDAVAPHHVATVLVENNHRLSEIVSWDRAPALRTRSAYTTIILLVLDDLGDVSPTEVGADLDRSATAPAKA